MTSKAVTDGDHKRAFWISRIYCIYSKLSVDLLPLRTSRFWEFFFGLVIWNPPSIELRTGTQNAQR